ncbi:MAG: deoxyribodipyrimidine photo-lyase [Bdellovibrionales bacterium]|nr:deoxyribodipyrimidine photo-lyase [Bdellovibrionales bacterium]
MNKVIHWFRQDLRLSDNPALKEASRRGLVLPLYILDTNSPKKMGSASRVWLYHSLKSLDLSLDKKLCFYQGDSLEILKHLIKTYLIKGVYWNRSYEPYQVKQDFKIKKELSGLVFESFSASLLWEPETIKKEDGTPYKVFTPFYKKGCLKGVAPRKPLDKPKPLQLYYDSSNKTHLEDLKLLPHLNWHKKIESHWEIGEEGAKKRFYHFLKKDLSSYKKGRNVPAKNSVSRLSPYLHFGQISPHQLWDKIPDRESDSNSIHFCRELAWREFSYNQLYHNKDLSHKNLNSKFDRFPWIKKESYLRAWQKGQTGIPLIDAGMRELWETAYMHNRIRMLVGSFLVKNLLLDWRQGERWFWDCLVDADLANNSASWQWIAGCGYDAAPYFRIFNPISQAQKFDPEGIYIRQFVPELKKLKAPYIFSPWDAPKSVLKSADVQLGIHYPHPLVDLKNSREKALQAFQSIKRK